MNIKIEIDIMDDYKYGLVAILVDSPYFLASIYSARKELNINELPYQFKSTPYKEANNVIDYYKRGACSIYDVYSCFYDICREHSIPLVDSTLPQAYKLAKLISDKFGKNRSYLPVTLASLLVGTIREEDLITTSGFLISKESLRELNGDLEESDNLLAIIVNRESTLNEVKDIFDFYSKYHFGTKKVEKKDAFLNIYKDEIAKDKLPSTRSTIKTVREWYWWNKEDKLTPSKILKYKLGDNLGYNIKTIEMAISRYKKSLLQHK